MADSHCIYVRPGGRGCGLVAECDATNADFELPAMDRMDQLGVRFDLREDLENVLPKYGSRSCIDMDHGSARIVLTVDRFIDALQRRRDVGLWANAASRRNGGGVSVPRWLVLGTFSP